MDIPYIDFPGGPYDVLPEPAPIAAPGSARWVVGSPDASILLAVTTNGSAFYLAVSLDQGATWAEEVGVVLANTEVPNADLDLWYDIENSRFVAAGSIAVPDIHDVAGTGFSAGWMTSTDGVLWAEQTGSIPEAPGLKRWVSAGYDVETGEWTIGAIHETPEPDTRAVLILDVEGGYFMTGWHTDSSVFGGGGIAMFSEDGEAWTTVSLPNTVFGTEEGPNVFFAGLYGRFASLPDGSKYLTGKEGWHGAVEFRFGIPVVPPFWTNHVNTVEFI